MSSRHRYYSPLEICFENANVIQITEFCVYVCNVYTETFVQYRNSSVFVEKKQRRPAVKYF